MTAASQQWIQIVVPSEESPSTNCRKEDVRLPSHASIADLLAELKATSSPLYEDVRRRVLRLSADVLAFGRERPDLGTLRDQLAQGGPVIIPEPPQD